MIYIQFFSNSETIYYNKMKARLKLNPNYRSRTQLPVREESRQNY